jgi:hypothetical protein
VTINTAALDDRQDIVCKTDRRPQRAFPATVGAGVMVAAWVFAGASVGAITTSVGSTAGA